MNASGCVQFNQKYLSDKPTVSSSRFPVHVLSEACPRGLETALLAASCQHVLARQGAPASTAYCRRRGTGTLNYSTHQQLFFEHHPLGIRPMQALILCSRSI